MYDPTKREPAGGTVRIVPAVLPKSFKDLSEHLERIAGGAKRVQVDIVDGSYAPHKTWPYHDGGTFKKIIEEEHGLPHWDVFDYEFDLMVANPLEVLMSYVHAGASHIIVHARSQTSVEAVQKLVDLRSDLGAFEVKVGVALMPDAQPEELEPFEAQYDYVQVMGVEHIGKQGEPFDKRALNLLERLRRRYPELPLQVDGSVNKDTARSLVEAGANVLVAGSAVFGQDDALAAIVELEKIANGTI